MGYPLGNSALIQPSVMINLIGAEGQSGEADYQGLEEALRNKNAFVHLYGKKLVKPGRKMGHVTLMGPDPADLLKQANQLKKSLQIRAI